MNTGSQKCGTQTWKQIAEKCFGSCSAIIPSCGSSLQLQGSWWLWRPQGSSIELGAFCLNAAKGQRQNLAKIWWDFSICCKIQLPGRKAHSRCWAMDRICSRRLLKFQWETLWKMTKCHSLFLLRVFLVKTVLLFPMAVCQLYILHQEKCLPFRNIEQNPMLDTGNKLWT